MRRRQPDPIEVQQMRAQAVKDQENRDLIRFDTHALSYYTKDQSESLYSTIIRKFLGNF